MITRKQRVHPLPDQTPLTMAPRNRRKQPVADASDSTTRAKRAATANEESMNPARRAVSSVSASTSRLLSTDPSRPIDIREIHAIQNLHVFRAFGLLAVLEQVQRQSCRQATIVSSSTLLKRRGRRQAKEGLFERT